MTFTGGNFECFNVTIIDDVIFESAFGEVFQVKLQVMISSFSLPPRFANINIQDNDGM